MQKCTAERQRSVWVHCKKYTSLCLSAIQMRNITKKKKPPVAVTALIIIQNV